MGGENMDKEKWIKSVLSNDEYSSDEELITYFMEEGKLTKDEAVAWVKKRDIYLNNIVMDNGTVVHHSRKTNKRWYLYNDAGGYFRLENGILMSCPINADSSRDDNPYEVDLFDVRNDKLIKGIIAELYKKE
jgi:hypothetical protein